MCEQRVDARRRILAEDLVDESLTGRPAVGVCARRERVRQLRERVVEQRDEIDRVPPGIRLLHPVRAGQLRRQRRQHGLRVLPAGDVERFQRLVDEVEGVPTVEVAVISRSREEHVGELL
jgi:hypothetical protein